MDRTKIAWTDATWNPIRGCSRVSKGCENCYAEKVAARFSGPGLPYEGTITPGTQRWNGKIRLVPKVLDQPLRWKKPRRIFVNSMSDLFHEGVPDSFIGAVFGVMAATPQHTYQILTKRPERMREWFTKMSKLTPSDLFVQRAAISAGADIPLHKIKGTIKCVPWPLLNVHLGVSVENQETADERIPLLLQTPAAVRFVSAEPLLGSINFHERFLRGPFDYCESPDLKDCVGCPGWSNEGGDYCGAVRGAGLDWVIVGGESGPGARPCNVEWIRDIVRQCRDAEVPCFVKQLGARPYCDRGGEAFAEHIPTTPGKGDDPSEWPDDLVVREFPK